MQRRKRNAAMHDDGIADDGDKRPRHEPIREACCRTCIVAYAKAYGWM